MQHNNDNTENREMNTSSSTALHEIHFTACMKDAKNKEQHIEQMILHGYYRSRIPDYGPLKGEAG